MLTITSPARRRAFLLTFDVEEFDLPRERGRPLERATECAITKAGMLRLVPMLADYGVRATFFVTARFATKDPDGIRALRRAGHEVAAHGLTHADDYARMDPTQATMRLRAARFLIEDIIGEPVRGIRTPRLRLCAGVALHDAGFAYDASPHPTWVPRRYNGLALPRVPWMEDGVIRVPISVLPGVRWPVSWIWYRALGTPLNRIAAATASAWAPYLHLYFHPWEATDLHHHLPRWLAVRSGDAFVASLEQLLRWATARFDVHTISELLNHLDSSRASSA